MSIWEAAAMAVVELTVRTIEKITTEPKDNEAEKKKREARVTWLWLGGLALILFLFTLGFS